jgi:hypothetical protein
MHQLQGVAQVAVFKYSEASITSVIVRPNLDR